MLTRSVILWICLFVAIPITGQRAYDPNRYKYYISPTFMVGSSNIIDSTTDFVNFRNRSYLINRTTSTGLYFSYLFKDRFSYYHQKLYGIKTGAIYSVVNQKIEFDPTPGKNISDIVTVKYTYRLVEIPFLFTKASTQNTVISYDIGPVYIYNLTNLNSTVGFTAKFGAYGTFSKRVGYYVLIGSTINQIKPERRTRVSFIVEFSATYRIIK